jgi:cytochrome P450
MADGRIPTAKEIASLPIQYLDACIEEFMRCSKAGPMTSRTSTTDAVVLGHVIPKGTRIFMMSSGAGVLTPAHEIPDSIRSPTYQSAGGGKIGSWDESMPEEMAAFNPDRWLRTEMNGSKVFDSTLGPQMGFGAGPRGCFGRKLAYLEVRLVIVLLLWHFELQKVPEHLGGYEAIEVLTHGPIHCYVRLSAAL